MAIRQVVAGILFADIADSHRLYNEAGDTVARETVLNCLRVMTDIVEAAGGKVVDRIGDELMCLFHVAAATPTGSILLQRDLGRAREEGRLRASVHVRIGFQCGPVILDGDRVFGDTVYIARRVATLAKGQQILTTRQTLDLLPATDDVQFRSLGPARLKGKTEPIEVFELIWDPMMATVNVRAPSPATEGAVARTLLVRYGEREHTIDAARPILTIGREEDRDIVVRDSAVSRSHARIEMRPGGFFLVDVSTNGTFVDRMNDPGILVRRDELRLGAHGSISFQEAGTVGSAFPRLTYREVTSNDDW